MKTVARLGILLALVGSLTTGRSMPQSPYDAVVTYVDRWMWDITMYMLELTVTVRDPKTDYPLATGNSLAS